MQFVALLTQLRSFQQYTGGMLQTFPGATVSFFIRATNCSITSMEDESLQQHALRCRLNSAQPSLVPKNRKIFKLLHNSRFDRKLTLGTHNVIKANREFGKLQNDFIIDRNFCGYRKIQFEPETQA